MKRAPLIIIIVLVLVCGVGSLVLRSGKPAPTAIAKDATAKVERGDVDVVVVETGTVNSAQVVELKSLVSGRLQKLLVDEGDHVTKGEPLAIIDPRETQLQVDQLRAQVKGAQNSVEKASVDLDERRRTVVDDIASAKTRLIQAEAELKAQPSLTKEAIQQAQNALNSSVAERKRLVESAHPTTRASSLNAVAEAEANLANADAEVKRETQLLAKGFVSKKVVEDAELNYRLAQTRLSYAKASDAKLEAGLEAEVAKADEAIRQNQAALRSAVLNAFQDKVKAQAYLSAQADLQRAEATKAEIASLERSREVSRASVEQLAAQLRDGERNLGETTILAPIDGYVTKKEIQVGELVTSIGGFSSGSAIVRIEDRSKMKIALEVNEIDMARLKMGMSATITVDALPEKTFHGKVTKLAPSSTALNTTVSTTSAVATGDAVVKYDVEIQVTDPTPELRSGMSAKCTLNTLHVGKVLKAPLEFIGHDGDKTYVMVLPGGDLKAKPERHEVKTGTESGAFVEVKTGVNEGDILARPTFTGPKRKGVFGGGGD
jgi:HlyD family secretion protein